MTYLSPFIDEYITNFDYVRDKEGYKWKFLKTFKKHYDLNADDFHQMLDRALKDDDNLLVANTGTYQYLPKLTLLILAEHYPEEVRNMFKLLENNADVDERMEIFKKRADELTSSCYEKGFLRNNTSHQDRHAVSVYLSAIFPELFYIYKFSIFEKFVKLTNSNCEVRMGNKGVLHYFRLCEEVREALISDHRIMSLHNKWLIDNDFTDPGYHLLTQDFIYSVAYHLKLDNRSIVSEPIAKTPIIVIAHAKSVQVKTEEKQYFKGIRDNSYFEEGKRKVIGDLGEKFVLQFERQQLIKCGKPKLKDKVRHISVEEGDGTGYDILSYDSNGRKKYIEVKTTSGKLTQPFFITKTELARSIKEQDQYYLYRVYNFDQSTNSGQIFIIQGDLTGLCQVPTNFSVRLKDY